jgi:hypothetical protein
VRGLPSSRSAYGHLGRLDDAKTGGLPSADAGFAGWGGRAETTVLLASRAGIQRSVPTLDFFFFCSPFSTARARAGVPELPFDVDARARAIKLGGDEIRALLSGHNGALGPLPHKRRAVPS